MLYLPDAAVTAQSIIAANGVDIHTGYPTDDDDA